VMLTDRSAAVGRTLADCDFNGLVEVTGVRRRGERAAIPEADFRFESGDIVVLLGRPGNLAVAERRLMRG
jgi:monovalent cation:H+ antiporter-2, CPA2 family